LEEGKGVFREEADSGAVPVQLKDEELVQANGNLAEEESWSETSEERTT